MSAGRKRPRKRKPAPAKKTVPKTDSAAASPQRGTARLASAGKILGECTGAICLVEVSRRSLESQEIGHPEQDVLKPALRLLWSVHDWIDESTPDLEDEDDDGEDES